VEGEGIEENISLARHDQECSKLARLARAEDPAAVVGDPVAVADKPHSPPKKDDSDLAGVDRIMVHPVIAEQCDSNKGAPLFRQDGSQ